MNQCPECHEWSLDYDSYFGRYRCFNPECEWMAPSSVEREIRILKYHQKPKEFFKKQIPDLGLNVTAAYDETNDALLFDFGIKEPTYDLPEPNGCVIWKIAHLSEMAAGVVILGAKKFAVSGVMINIKAHKEEIEEILKKTPHAFSAGRPTRILIDQVELRINSEEPLPQQYCFINEVIANFKEMFVDC